LTLPAESYGERARCWIHAGRNSGQAMQDKQMETRKTVISSSCSGHALNKTKDLRHGQVGVVFDTEDPENGYDNGGQGYVLSCFFISYCSVRS